jgi:hypothetical protein
MVQVYNRCLTTMTRVMVCYVKLGHSIPNTLRRSISMLITENAAEVSRRVKKMDWASAQSPLLKGSFIVGLSCVRTNYMH